MLSGRPWTCAVAGLVVTANPAASARLPPADEMGSVSSEADLSVICKRGEEIAVQVLVVVVVVDDDDDDDATSIQHTTGC